MVWEVFCGSGEELLQPFVKSFVDRMVFLPAKLSEVFQCRALFKIQAGGDFDLNLSQDIAARRAVERGHTMRTNAEDRAVLCSSRDF